MDPRSHIAHVTKGDKWIWKVSAISFFSREQQEWGSSMREDEPGARGDHHRGRGSDFTQQGTVPQQGRLLAACSHQQSSDTSSDVKWPAGYRICLGSLVRTSRRQDWGLHCGAVGSSRKFMQQFKIRGDGTVHSPAHSTVLTCLSYSGTLGLDRSFRKGCWGHPRPRYSSQNKHQLKDLVPHQWNQEIFFICFQRQYDYLIF